MKEHICQDISYETLVAYADGELPLVEAEQITKHIAQCEKCQTMLSALQRSLQITQEIWQSDEARWPKKHSFKKPFLSRWLIRRLATVAASILLVIGIGVMQRILYRPSEQIRPVRPETMVAEIDDIEIEVQRAAVAAQLLAVADMLAAQPGAEEYAEKRYTYVINSFPGRNESEQAKLRLQNLLERRIKQ
ncbi:MAG: anti-sigma factor family protein [Planctomycetota bacterium]